MPANVRRFILDNITSLEQLEVLLLLRRTAPQDWTAESVARELRIAAPSAARRLEDLTARHLLAVTAEAEPTYRFSPSDEKDRDLVAALAEAYETHRFSVITLVFSKPNDAVRLFADAFKIRDKDENS